MLRMMIAALSLAAFLTPAMADKPLREDVAIGEVGTALEKVARDAGLPDFEVRRRNCVADVDAVCSYSLPGEIGLMASADEEGGAVETMTLIFGKGSTGDGLIFGSGMMIAVADPTLTRDERGAVLLKLMETVTTLEDREAQTKNVSYSATVSSLAGLWIIARAR